MLARKLLTGVSTLAVTVTVISLSAGAASAAPDSDDTTFTATTADIIGVGSDTSQNMIKRIADSYNTGRSTGRIATFAATNNGANNPNNIPLPSGDIARPANSGAGRGLLYGGTGNVGNTDVDFARSSGALAGADVSAGLQAIPYALDSVGVVVSAQVASHAPASLTATQIYQIFNGDVTNWNQVGGANGAIKLFVPNSGSGTRTFFEQQLQALANRTAAPAYPTGTTTFGQENSPGPIQMDADTIAPYSIGLAGLAGSNNLRVINGFAPKRAIYNVVRGSDVNTFASIFGSNGYVCSAAAKPLIEAAGFRQLFTPSKGGVCGQQTQSATSNFTVDNVATATGVTVTSASATSARVVARVTADTAPSGTVTFFEGATAVASNVPLASGQAVATPGASAGSHTYRAVFTPAANTAFTGSEGTGTGVVTGVAAAKAAPVVSESFPAKAKLKTTTVKGKKKTVVKPLKGSINVGLTGTSTKGTGAVVIKRGSKTVGTGTLSGGVATFTIKKGLKPGKNKLTATWAGDANGSGGSVNFTVKAGDTKKAKGKGKK